MILNPIIPIWLISILTIALIAYIVWFNKKINKKVILRISIIIMLFIINLRPMVRSNNVKSSTSNLNILFVIDTTLSMNAEDVDHSKTRLEQVKKDCEYIINKFPDSNYSLITFNNKSKVQMPFTSDRSMVLNSINILQSINELYANGSSLNTPQKDMLKILKNGKDKNSNLNILFYISDGEITDDSKLSSFKDIKEYVDNGAVLGYGTSDGGYMKYIDYNDEEVYVTYYDKNYNEKKGVSVIDEDNLNSIADDIGIKYVNMKKQSNIDSIIKDINKNANSQMSDDTKDAYDDLYFIFVLPLLVLLILLYKEYKEEYSL